MQLVQFIRPLCVVWWNYVEMTDFWKSRTDNCLELLFSCLILTARHIHASLTWGGGELNNYLDGSLKIDSNIFSTFYIGIAQWKKMIQVRTSFSWKVIKAKLSIFFSHQIVLTFTCDNEQKFIIAQQKVQFTMLQTLTWRSSINIERKYSVLFPSIDWFRAVLSIHTNFFH